MLIRSEHEKLEWFVIKCEKGWCVMSQDGKDEIESAMNACCRAVDAKIDKKYSVMMLLIDPTNGRAMHVIRGDTQLVFEVVKEMVTVEKEMMTPQKLGGLQ